jgi:DNA segregation ATPase FtsK/SpoIIIE-like protein
MLISSYCLAIYETYGVKIYQYTKDTIEAIRNYFHSLGDKSLGLQSEDNKALGVFPCRTFNLATQSVSVPHTDHNNLSHGWCSITPLGDFNPTLRGHLVLWNFKLIIEFPLGSTILILLSIIVHSNTPIKPNKTRNSIVQYASGHLYRWVKNSFLTDKEWKEQAIVEQLRQWEMEKDNRRKSAVALFTTLDELEETEERVRATVPKKKRRL